VTVAVSRQSRFRDTRDVLEIRLRQSCTETCFAQTVAEMTVFLHRGSLPVVVPPRCDAPQHNQICVDLESWRLDATGCVVPGWDTLADQLRRNRLVAQCHVRA